MKRITCFVMGLVVASASAQEQKSPIEMMFERPAKLYAGLSVDQWSTMAFWVAIGLAASFATNLVVRTVLNFISKRQGLNRILIKGVRRASSVLVFPYAFGFGLESLDLHGGAAEHISQALQAIQILGFVLILLAGWDIVSEHIALRSAGQNKRADRLLIPVTRKLIRAVIITGGLMIAVATLTNVNLVALVASMGIGGLVVALAAKDSIENVFGSMTILFDTPFAIGDWVRIDKVEGIIEEINLRSTRIRTVEDTLITLPNANLIRAAVENFGARRFRRQKLQIKLMHDSAPEKIQELEGRILAYLQTMRMVNLEKTLVKIDGVDEFGISLLVQTFFEAETQAVELELRNELLLEILSEAKSLGIELAHRTQ